MKRINITNTGGAGMTAEDWNFIFTATREAIQGFLTAFNIDTTDDFIISGCEKTLVSGVTYDFSGGWVCIAGEVVRAPSKAGVDISISARLAILEDNISPSPIDFEDVTTHDVHFETTADFIDYNAALVVDQIELDDLLTIHQIIARKQVGDWHVIGAVDEPAYESGKIAGSGSQEPFRYRINADGNLEFDGVFGGSELITPGMKNVFRLPNGHRPGKLNYIPAVQYRNSSGDSASYIQVNTDGWVKAYFDLSGGFAYYVNMQRVAI